MQTANLQKVSGLNLAFCFFVFCFQAIQQERPPWQFITGWVGWL